MRWQGNGESYIMRSWMICIPYPILCGWLNREGWDGQDIWRVWGRKEVCTGCWWGNLRERGCWGDPVVDGRIKLRWMLRKLEGVVGTGWSWLRIGTGGGRAGLSPWDNRGKANSWRRHPPPSPRHIKICQKKRSFAVLWQQRVYWTNGAYIARLEV
jgi:hypothetical protein